MADRRNFQTVRDCFHGGYGKRPSETRSARAARTGKTNSGDYRHGAIKWNLWTKSGQFEGSSKNKFRMSLILKHGPVAQLDRASDFGSEGWGFDSLRGRHYSKRR